MAIHDWTKVDAGIFHDFHLMWIAALRRALKSRLPKGYYALAEQVTGGGNPDVLALHSPNPDEPSDHSRNDSSDLEHGGGIATATSPPKTRFHDRVDSDVYSRRARSIVIRHISGDRVVAMIEIVPPGNKWSETAFNRFKNKAHSLLLAGIHLLIVDLFPPSTRDPRGIHPQIWSGFKDGDFYRPFEKPLTLVAYLAGDSLEAYFEPVAVGDDLPDMPLFLDPDLYASVPLNETYDSAWNDVPSQYQAILSSSS